MWRHEAVRGGEPGDDGDAEVEKWQLGLAREGEDDGDEQHHADAEKDRQADDEGHEHERPVEALFPEGGDERLRDDLRAAGLGEELAQHGAKANDDGDETERAADALLKGLRDVEQPHAGAQADAERGEHEADEGVHLPAGDEEDEQRHRRRCVKEQRGLRAEAGQSIHGRGWDCGTRRVERGGGVEANEVSRKDGTVPSGPAPVRTRAP